MEPTRGKLTHVLASKPNVLHPRRNGRHTCMEEDPTPWTPGKCRKMAWTRGRNGPRGMQAWKQTTLRSDGSKWDEEKNGTKVGPWYRVRGGQAEDRSLGHIAFYGLHLAQFCPPNDEECEVDDNDRASFVSFVPFHGTGMRAIRCPPRKACTLHACSSSRDDRRQPCGLVFVMTLSKRSNA